MDQTEKLDQLQGEIESLKKRIEEIHNGAELRLMEIRDRLDKLEETSKDTGRTLAALGRSAHKSA